MAMAEKANEPTMDEILASIRKIIAEEPVSKAGVAPVVVAEPKLPVPRASIDDILGMADAPEPKLPVKAEAAPKQGGDVPLPAAMTKTATSVPQPKPAAPAEASRAFFPAPTGSKGADKSSAEAETPKMDFSSIVPGKGVAPLPDAEAERRPIAGRLPEWLSRPAAPLPSSGSAPTLPFDSQPAASVEPANHLDRKATPEAKPVEAPPAKAATSASPVNGQSVLPEAKAVKPGAANPEMVNGATDATKAPSAKPSGAVNASAGAATANPASALTAAGSNAQSPAKVPVSAPAASAASGKLTTPAASTSASSTPAASQSASKPAAASRPAATAGGSAQNQPVASAAAPAVSGSNGAVPAKSTAAPVISPAMEKPATVPVAESAPAVSKPAVLDKSKGAKPANASGELVPSASPLAGVRTLDDTIIELLRPMIRQWLDDNMPRMVEKALRIELAASLQAKGTPGKGDPSKH